MTVSDMIDDAGSLAVPRAIVEFRADSTSRYHLERSQPDARVPRRPGGAVKPVRDLIQTSENVEFPATGRWSIPAGQRLDVTTRWPLRRRRPVFTTGGVLDIPVDPFATRIELELAVGDDRRLPAIRCAATLLDADRLGAWTFTGGASVGVAPSTGIVLRARYQGVYDHGARPVALLRIEARLPSPTTRRWPERRPRARVDVGGDINACHLYTYPSPSPRP